MDGEGSLPDDLRRKELARNGTYSVSLTPTDRTRLMARLRSAFGLTLPEVSFVLSSLPGIFRNGLTRKEAECMAEALREAAETEAALKAQELEQLRREDEGEE
jgi:hypothetical protein